MIPEGSTEFWPWFATVAIATAGGLLGILATAMQSREAAVGVSRGMGFKLMLASYGLMTVSMLVFVLRGLLW